MTVLANALLSIPAGQNTRAPQTISSALKNPGVAQILRVTLDATNFPLTSPVTITIGISIDNGATFRTASITSFSPTLPSRFPGSYVITLSLDDNSTVTNAQLSTDSPSAFQTQTLIEII
jgi:hypothetical protein